MNTPHKQAVSSTYEVGERLAMTEVDSGDTTYSDGVDEYDMGADEYVP